MRKVLPTNCNLLLRIREADARGCGDPWRRRFEMEELRHEFFISWIASRLGETHEGTGLSEHALRDRVAQLLAKPGSRAAPNNPMLVRRSEQEERFVTSAKVAWHKLLKSEGIAAARPRKSDSPPTSLRAVEAKLRRLHGLDAKPVDGARLLRSYIAQHARHLREVCAKAKDINSGFLSAELEHAVADLHSASCGDDTQAK